MASTNSTDKPLNYWYNLESQNGVYSLYAKDIDILTGNMEDKDGKVVKNKYVSGKVFNNTYTLRTDKGNFEEAGHLMNYDDGVTTKGSTIGALDSQKWYTIWGSPNKWIYDSHQEYNNCGVDSCLNVLSIAGKIDIVEPSESVIAELTAPKTVTKKDIYGNTTTKTVKSKIEVISSEEELTLYAIQHDYANHSKDLIDYKTAKDIEFEDGGTYFSKVGSESHLYHDTIDSINSILNAYGVASSTKAVEVVLPYEAEETTMQDEVIPVEEGHDKVPSNDTYKVKKGMGTVTITSVDGNDILSLEMTKDDLMKQRYLVVRKDNDLYLNYTQTNSIIIKNFYTPEELAEGEEFTESHINTIKFADGSTENLKNFVGDYLLDCEYYDYENSGILDTNLRKYGDFLHTLADHIKAGEGVILQGSSDVLAGRTGDNINYNIDHAITLVGVVTDQNNAKDPEHPEISRPIEDVSGFYVVDTGGHLASADGAQFISVELLRDFLTAKKSPDKADETFTSYFVSTDENIKIWADKLNIVGNSRRNLLQGNDSDNVLDGKGDSDILYGRGGDDTLYGGAGNDTLYGGSGDNTLNGGAGNDTYAFSKYNRPLYKYEQMDDIVYRGLDEITESHDLIIPGTGKDILRFENYKLADLEFGNKGGSLVISYDDGKRSVTVKDYFSKSLYDAVYKIEDQDSIYETLKNNEDYGKYAYKLYDVISQAQIKHDKYVNTETTNNIKGTKFNDIIIGAEFNDTINSGAGKDTITGGAGNDLIKAGAGNDIIYGGYGNDKIYGETGTNYIKYEENFGGNDTIYSGKGYDYIELTSKTREDLVYTQKGKNLVVTYDQSTGASLTITNYFANKGKTSVQSIKLKDGDVLDLIREYGSVVAAEKVANIKKTASSSGDTLVGSYGHDTLTGKNGDDVIVGGIGDDVIKGGKGDDTITGGLGNDKLYGQAGNNTFIFESLNEGLDTIYASGKGDIILDFSSTDLEFDGEHGFVDGYEKYSLGDKNYAYTKSGNDLIIDYATGVDKEGQSTIRLQNYFKSKNSYNLLTQDGILDLKDATIYFAGNQSKTNKITGTAQNDIIFGGSKNDTIKGGKGDDTITAGLGNDNITGGAGHNTVIYNAGDGADVINLTKNETLDIKLYGDTFDTADFSFKIDSKGNLLISCDNTKIMTIKNFGKKDVTTSNGGVNLYVNDSKLLDLREDIYLPEYNSFSKKKASYTGTWHSEYINASDLSSATGKNSKGVSINGGAGNDIIVGSKFNDTIKGGAGEDLIVGGFGKNTLDGGAGSDTYYLFMDDSDVNRFENSVIKDTGKGSSDIDIAEMYTVNKENLSELSIWFNIDKKGKVTHTFNIDDGTNKATLSGVEQIVTSDGYSFDYTKDELVQEVVTWLEGTKFADVSAVLSKGTKNEQNQILAIFVKEDYWTNV